VQLVAWQALAAACGAVRTVNVMPNDSATWDPTADSACVLLATASSPLEVQLSRLDDDSSPASFVCAVAWPLFDCRSEKTLTPLMQAWAAPSLAGARWAVSVQQPLLVWSDETRADVSAFLQVSFHSTLLLPKLRAPLATLCPRLAGRMGSCRRVARDASGRAFRATQFWQRTCP
jgi:hypothetical protein